MGIEMMLLKTRSRRLVPKMKPDRKKKPKQIPRRARFKDCTKPGIHRRFTDYEVMVRAEICRQDRLKNPTQAEKDFAEFLSANRIFPEREKIYLNGDRHILVDFYFPQLKLAIEIDGSVHYGQEGYDDGRDAWLLERNVKTVRISNARAQNPDNEIRKLLGLLPVD
jgi:very-short-patch-repair endonuclease